MPASSATLKTFALARGRLGVAPTTSALTVSIGRQSISLLEKVRRPIPPFAERSRPSPSWRDGTPNGYRCIRTFRCSTSRFGIGQQEGSHRTPLGLHRIVEKIGGGWPVGTVFKSRQAVGFTWKEFPSATITNRILWLEGLEPGFNRGGEVDSHQRYIYIHGTGDETTLGRPASCGCIHLAGDDLIPLFDKLPAGTLVWIEG